MNPRALDAVFTLCWGAIAVWYSIAYRADGFQRLILVGVWLVLIAQRWPTVEGRKR